MKKIEIEITEPIMLKNEELVSVTYSVNSNKEFTGTTINHIVKNNNMFYHSFDYEFSPYEVIYIRITLNIKAVDGTIYSVIINEYSLTENTKIINNNISAFPVDFTINAINETEIEIKSEEPKFYIGSAIHKLTIYKIYDIYNNLIYFFKGYNQDRYYKQIDLSRFNYLNVVVLEVEYIFDKEIYQPKKREFYILNRNNISRYNIDRKVLFKNQNNLVRIVFFYESLSKITYIVKNAFNHQPIMVDDSSNLSVVIPADIVNQYESLILGIYVEGDIYGPNYTEFTLNIIEE